jgi:hypothetical protein
VLGGLAAVVPVAVGSGVVEVDSVEVVVEAVAELPAGRAIVPASTAFAGILWTSTPTPHLTLAPIR